MKTAKDWVDTWLGQRSRYINKESLFSKQRHDESDHEQRVWNSRDWMGNEKEGIEGRVDKQRQGRGIGRKNSEFGSTLMIPNPTNLITNLKFKMTDPRENWEVLGVKIVSFLTTVSTLSNLVQLDAT